MFSAWQKGDCAEFRAFWGTSEPYPFCHAYSYSLVSTPNYTSGHRL
jgi:hypothetical protein